jgi:hypothetical protein
MREKKKRKCELKGRDGRNGGNWGNKNWENPLSSVITSYNECKN